MTGNKVTYLLSFSPSLVASLYLKTGKYICICLSSGILAHLHAKPKLRRTLLQGVEWPIVTYTDMSLYYFADIIASLRPTITLAIQNPRTFALCVHTVGLPPIRSTLSTLAYSVILALDSITD